MVLVTEEEKYRILHQKLLTFQISLIIKEYIINLTDWSGPRISIDWMDLVVYVNIDILTLKYDKFNSV